MITIKYASKEQHKLTSIEILWNLCRNLNVHVGAIQDLIQTIKNLIICTKSQTKTKFRSVYIKIIINLHI